MSRFNHLRTAIIDLIHENIDQSMVNIIGEYENCGCFEGDFLPQNSDNTITFLAKNKILFKNHSQDNDYTIEIKKKSFLSISFPLWNHIEMLEFLYDCKKPILEIEYNLKNKELNFFIKHVKNRYSFQLLKDLGDNSPYDNLMYYHECLVKTIEYYNSINNSWGFPQLFIFNIFSL